MIVNRIVAPASKLAIARALDPATAASSLGVELGLGEVDEDELYDALDWLHQRQPAIETALAKRHLKGGALVLYDVSSSYLEGRCCPLAARGYNRDGKKGKLQIVYGLLCAADGCPVATEPDLAAIASAVARKRNPLRGAAEIGLKVGAVLGKRKMARHFDLAVTDVGFAFSRKTAESAAKAALDGIYAVRMSLPSETIGDAGTVRAHKSLSLVERALRCIKTIDLHVRPIHHWLADRVRAHVFLCMLAYHVEWHMRARLAPMLFDDDDKEAAEALRDSPVARTQRSPRAIAKQTTGRTADRTPVHSFRSLLADLATIARNTVFIALAPEHRFNILTRPTPLQQKAFELLAITIICTR
jgi:hypothetical protein